MKTTENAQGFASVIRWAFLAIFISIRVYPRESAAKEVTPPAPFE
jgi:hypothetical protein